MKNQKKPYKRRVPALSPEVFQHLKWLESETKRYTIEEGLLSDQQFFRQNKTAAQSIESVIQSDKKLNNYERGNYLYYLAIAYTHLDNIDKAIKSYQGVIALSPKITMGLESLAYTNMAKIYLDHMKFLDAESILLRLKQVIDNENDLMSRRYKHKYPAEGNYMLAKIAMHRGDYDKARGLLEAILCKDDCKSFETKKPVERYFTILKQVYFALQKQQQQDFTARISDIESLIKPMPYTLLYQEAFRPIVIPRSNPRHGECTLSFDLNTRGKPENIKVLACANRDYEVLVIKTFSKFVFEPIQDKLGNITRAEHLTYEFTF